MSTTSERDAGFPGETPLDVQLCSEIGVQLGRARQARGLSVADVGHALLLSTRQVRALEQVDFTAFHNASFYIAGLKKYVQFAELDPAVIGGAASMVPSSPRAAPVGRLSLDASSDSRVAPSRAFARAAAAGVLVIAAAAAAAYALWPQAAPSSPVSSASPVASRPQPASVAVADPPRDPAVVGASSGAPADGAPAAVSAARVPADPRSGTFGTIRAAKGTWVFVRSAEGVELERTLPDGGSLSLDSAPAYLAVGSTDAVLTVGDHLVDTAPFVVNGQIRMRGTDFDSLPPRAPTPATPRRR